MWMIAENFNGKSHNSNVISLYVSGKGTLIYTASEIETIPVYSIFIFYTNMHTVCWPTVTVLLCVFS